MIRFFTLFFFMTCFCSSVHAIESARSKVQLRFKDIGINQMMIAAVGMVNDDPRIGSLVPEMAEAL